MDESGTPLWTAAFALASFFVADGLPSLEGQTAPAPSASRAAPSPFDEPINWLLEARCNFTAVKDYTCTLSKRENVSGTLSEEHIIEAKFRTQPFSVYMRWLAPSKFYNQEAAFILGRNNNKMRVHFEGAHQRGRRVCVRRSQRSPRDGAKPPHHLRGRHRQLDRAGPQICASGKRRRRRPGADHGGHAGEPPLPARGDRSDSAATAIRVLSHRALSGQGLQVAHPAPRITTGRAAGGPPTGSLMEQVAFTNLRWNLGLTDREFSR